MSSNANLPLLKEAFQPLMTIRDSVAHLFELLEAKTVQLKQCYGEYIRQSSNDSLVFGLDSFHFQGKLIDLEFQDMRRMFMAIDNRMYGEYYKLRKWMRQSCESLVAAHPTAAANNHNHNNHHISTASTAAMRRAVVFKDELEGEVEVYRDLEPYRVYCVEHLLRLHDDILRVLQWMNELIEEKELQLRHHQEKEHVGLNINNFVHSFRFEITIIREKQRLFVSFLEFFHTLHVKYLERVAAKVELMYEQLNHDIQWDPHVGHPALRTTIAAGTSGTATAAATTITNTTHTSFFCADETICTHPPHQLDHHRRRLHPFQPCILDTVVAVAVVATRRQTGTHHRAGKGEEDCAMENDDAEDEAGSGAIHRVAQRILRILGPPIHRILRPRTPNIPRRIHVVRDHLNIPCFSFSFSRFSFSRFDFSRFDFSRFDFSRFDFSRFDISRFDIIAVFHQSGYILGGCCCY